MSVLSLTLVPELVLELSLATGGRHGDSFLDGRPSMEIETSDGLKQLDLSYSSELSSLSMTHHGTSSYMETTREWLKVGGTVTVNDVFQQNQYYLSGMDAAELIHSEYVPSTKKLYRCSFQKHL